MYDNGLELKDIEQVNLTGVGSTAVEQAIYGLPTYKVDEFSANGVGGGYFAGDAEEFMVVSMGTGTSFVGVKNNVPMHLGGIGIGGGTIIGLSNLEITASNFGKASTRATCEDKAAGIVHMVLETICQTAVLISQGTNIKDFVLIGNLINFPECNHICDMIKTMYPDIHVIVPEDGEYGTAIGAALAEQCCLNPVGENR